MLHPWYIGHFDEESVRSYRPRVRERIDPDHIRMELEQAAELKNGFYYIERDRFAIRDEGYLCCLDFVHSRRASEFITDFATRNGCEIVFPETASICSPSEFAAFFERSDERRRADRIRWRAARGLDNGSGGSIEEERR